jgi:hypothetical protein
MVVLRWVLRITPSPLECSVWSVASVFSMGTRASISTRLMVVLMCGGGRKVWAMRRHSPSSAVVMRMVALKIEPASVLSRLFWVRVPSSAKNTVPVVVLITAIRQSARICFSPRLKRPRFSGSPRVAALAGVREERVGVLDVVEALGRVVGDGDPHEAAVRHAHQFDRHFGDAGFVPCVLDQFANDERLVLAVEQLCQPALVDLKPTHV